MALQLPSPSVAPGRGDESTKILENLNILIKTDWIITKPLQFEMNIHAVSINRRIACKFINPRIDTMSYLAKYEMGENGIGEFSRHFRYFMESLLFTLPSGVYFRVPQDVFRI